MFIDTRWFDVIGVQTKSFFNVAVRLVVFTWAPGVVVSRHDGFTVGARLSKMGVSLMPSNDSSFMSRGSIDGSTVSALAMATGTGSRWQITTGAVKVEQQSKSVDTLRWGNNFQHRDRHPIQHRATPCWEYYNAYLHQQRMAHS
jgi:hypothetical protein